MAILLEEQTTWFFSKLFLSSLLVTLSLLLIHMNRGAKTKKTKLPPSVPKLPIIGNLHQLGDRPHRSLRDLSQKHGPLMLLQLGWHRSLIVSSAEMAQEFLKTHDLNFASRPVLISATKLSYGLRDVIFSPYNDHWRQAKKVCVVEMLSNKRVQSFRSIREQGVADMISKISGPKGSAFNASKVFLGLTNDVVCMVALGVNAKMGMKAGDKSFSELSREINMLMSVINVGDLFPGMGWVDVLTGLDWKMKKHSQAWDTLFDRVIEEHQDPSRAENETSDFIEVLLRVMKDSTLTIPFTILEVKALVLDMIVAATETTATTLEWAMSLLVKHPEVMKKAQLEVRSVVGEKQKIEESDLQKMDYLRSAVKETLRLYPPAPLLLPREAIKDIEIGGYVIPSKTRVYINAWQIGRDPALWERAEEFRPDRFIDSSIDFRGTDFLFIPFGGGRRGCPGISFAIPILEFALANLLHQLDWELPNGGNVEELDMTEKSALGVILRRKSELMLVAKPHFS